MKVTRQPNGQIGTDAQRAEIKRQGWVLTHYELNDDGESWHYTPDVEIENLNGLIAEKSRKRGDR